MEFDKKVKQELKMKLNLWFLFQELLSMWLCIVKAMAIKSLGMTVSFKNRMSLKNAW